MHLLPLLCVFLKFLFEKSLTKRISTDILYTTKGKTTRNTFPLKFLKREVNIMKEMTNIQKKMAHDLIGTGKHVFCMHTVGDNHIATNGYVKSLNAFTLEFQVDTLKPHGITGFTLGLTDTEIIEVERKSHSICYEIKINSIEKFTFIL